MLLVFRKYPFIACDVLEISDAPIILFPLVQPGLVYLVLWRFYRRPHVTQKRVCRGRTAWKWALERRDKVFSDFL